MSFPPAHDPRTLRPLHVVMIALTAAVGGGGFLLLSAAESKTLVDGAAPWLENSPLRAVVQLLCLNYAVPTIHAGDVKSCILGIGAGVGLLALALAILMRNPSEGETPGGPPGENGGAMGARQRTRLHLSPLIAAQGAMGLYLLWSFASARWSDASELAIGASLLIAIFFLWSFALAHGLTPAAARIASRFVIAATAAAALAAIWYYYGRNWTIRAKFPFGNPNFLSVCLIPGILLSAALLFEKLMNAGRENMARRAAAMAGAIVTLALALWAFALADSRGPLIGLGAGFLVMTFFACRGWAKLLPAILGIALAISAGLYLYQRQHQSQPGGRDATLRFRAYAWDYAWRMAREKPFTGHGQAGYVRKADLYTVDDVENDPLVLSARVDHAHNEWLEVLADLGIVGLALVGGGLALTFLAGGVMLGTLIPPDRRWTLIALLGSLAAVVVSDMFGVGLRTPEVPVAFYTVLGLAWALSGGLSTNLVARAGGSGPARLLTGSVLGAAGVLALVLSQQDFQAARRAYQVDAAIAEGDYEKSLNFALQATNQLNSQRALTNLYRLAESRMRIARDLLARAVDRENRARATEMPDRSLLQLAAADRTESEQQAAEANRVLKELVTRSPGFLNHGYVEFMLNLITADHAAAKGDEQQRSLAVQNAVRALERELRRQPFDPHIARDYVRVNARAGDMASLLRILARPLRYNGVSGDDVSVLSPATERPEFEAYLRGLRSGAGVETPSPENAWRPEELRLAAATWFATGRYNDAIAALTAATQSYDAMGTAPLIGAASAQAELADVLFFAHPENPEPALTHAAGALSRIPDSRTGRELKDAVNSRRCDYLLAATREDEARQLLTQTAGVAVSTAELDAEVSERFRRLSDALLRSRLSPTETEVPKELLTLTQRWLDRARALDEQSAAVYLSLANVSFLGQDDATASAHLLAALERGLGPETAQRFLDIAAQRGRDLQAYAAVSAKIEAAAPAPNPP